VLEQDRFIIAWWGTDLECISALSRLEREQKIDNDSLTVAFDCLRSLRSSWNEIQPNDVVHENAGRLLRVHPLRTADSMQLAAAVVASNHLPATLDFVCNDKRLATAARKEGFRVLAVT
jgi:uncharacterized protein